MHQIIETLLKQTLPKSRVMLVIMCMLYGTLAGYSNQLPPSTSAQKEIIGTVIDHEGEPIIGATVKIKNSPSGTMTNVDGIPNFQKLIDAGYCDVHSKGNFTPRMYRWPIPAKEIMINENLKQNDGY